MLCLFSRRTLQRCESSSGFKVQPSYLPREYRIASHTQLAPIQDSRLPLQNYERRKTDCPSHIDRYFKLECRELYLFRAASPVLSRIYLQRYRSSPTHCNHPPPEMTFVRVKRTKPAAMIPISTTHDHHLHHRSSLALDPCHLRLAVVLPSGASPSFITTGQPKARIVRRTLLTDHGLPR
jgi:hypothetical protein